MPYYPPPQNPLEQQQEQQEQQEQPERELQPHHQLSPQQYQQRQYLRYEQNYAQGYQNDRTQIYHSEPHSYQSYQSGLPGFEQYAQGMNQQQGFHAHNQQPFPQYGNQFQQDQQQALVFSVPVQALDRNSASIFDEIHPYNQPSISNTNHISTNNSNVLISVPTTTMPADIMPYYTATAVPAALRPNVVNHDVYAYHGAPQLQLATTSLDSGVGLSASSPAMYPQSSPSSANFSVPQRFSSSYENVPNHPLEGVPGPSHNSFLDLSSPQYGASDPASPESELGAGDLQRDRDFTVETFGGNERRFRCLSSKCDRTVGRRVDMTRHYLEAHLRHIKYHCRDDPIVWARINYTGPGCVKQVGGCGMGFKRKEHYIKHLGRLRKEDKKSGRKPKKGPDSQEPEDEQPASPKDRKGKTAAVLNMVSSSFTTQKGSGAGTDNGKGKKRQATNGEDLSLISRMSRSFTSLSLSSRSPKSPKSPKSAKKTDMPPPQPKPQRICSKRRKHANA